MSAIFNGIIGNNRVLTVDGTMNQCGTTLNIDDFGTCVRIKGSVRIYIRLIGFLFLTTYRIIAVITEPVAIIKMVKTPGTALLLTIIFMVMTKFKCIKGNVYK